MNYSKESVKQLFNALINLEDPDKEFSMFELGWKVGASSWNANQPLDLIAKRALMTRLLKITLPNPSKQELEDSISQLINELKTEVNVDILPSEIIPKDAHDFHYIKELYYQAKKDARLNTVKYILEQLFITIPDNTQPDESEAITLILQNFSSNKKPKTEPTQVPVKVLNWLDNNLSVEQFDKLRDELNITYK